MANDWGDRERKDPLDQALARMRDALERGELSRREWRQTFREQRRLLREQRRAFRRRGPPRAIGWVFLGMAGMLTYLMVDGAPYFLVWPALGFAIAGVSMLFRRRDRDSVVEGQATPVAQPAADPAGLARIDSLCDKLLEEIKKGPAVLREVVRNPEESVRGLREAIHALAKREAEVKGLVTAADGERLQRERADLVARRDGAADPVTRQRWEEALKALDGQLQHRETLRTQGARLEAERVRLGYTLENLYTQVLAVRSTATSDQAGVQLKQSVERLGDEISAVAGALESMQAVDAGAAGTDSSETARPSRERI